MMLTQMMPAHTATPMPNHTQQHQHQPLPWMVIPVRSFTQGKRRLGGVLDESARGELNRDFLSQLLRQAARWPGLRRTVVVSPCTDVLGAARAAGARALRQPKLPHLDEASSQTLNAALEFARFELQRREAADLLVVSSDLPHASVDDFQRLAALARDGQGSRVAIAMDRAREGTNALFVPSGARMPFCFGPGSAKRHADAAAARSLDWTQAVLPGLGLDIDTPADLASWQRMNRRCS